MQLRSCAYRALYDLCKQNTLFDPSVFLSFVNSSYKFSSLESQRFETYNFFTDYEVQMPKTVAFTNKTELLDNLKLPCAVKFETSSTLGPQTLVLDEQSKLKTLYAQAQELTSGIVQQYIQGYEFTVTVLVGDKNWVVLGVAQDYKREYDNNIGLNTFGMGSTAPFAMPAGVCPIIDNIVHALQDRYDYHGLLSCQFIVDDDIWLLECNTRLCDPEFQSMTELLSNSVYDRIVECVDGDFINRIVTKNKNAVTVSLIHSDWPRSVEPVDIEFPENKFKIYKNPGTWDQGTYYGSITNSGDKTHSELADEIYEFLKVTDVTPYRYRTDIGNVKTKS